MPRKPGLDTALLPFVFPAVAFIVGMAVNAFTIAEKIATKPYVDEKAVATLKESRDYSDSVKQHVLLELEKYNSTIKSVEVKIDIIQQNLQQLMQERNAIRR